MLIACVSDGAGSAAQSEHGAALVVQSFQAHFAAAVGEAANLGAIDRDFVLQWLADIQAKIRVLADGAGAQPRDFACTFLGAVIGTTTAIFAQIGDGAIVVDNAGCHSSIFWPQHGEFANSTFFVTMDDAAEIIQIERRDSVMLNEIALFSDGLERLILDMRARTVHSPSLCPIFNWLAATEPTASGLPSDVVAAYLNSANVNRRTDDDKTLVMATRALPSQIATS